MDRADFLITIQNLNTWLDLEGAKAFVALFLEKKTFLPTCSFGLALHQSQPFHSSKISNNVSVVHSVSYNANIHRHVIIPCKMAFSVWMQSVKFNLKQFAWCLHVPSYAIKNARHIHTSLISQRWIGHYPLFEATIRANRRTWWGERCLWRNHLNWYIERGRHSLNWPSILILRQQVSVIIVHHEMN